MINKLKNLSDTASRLEKAELPDEIREDIRVLVEFARQRLAIAHDAAEVSPEIMRIFDPERRRTIIHVIVFQDIGIRTLDELCNMTKEEFEAAFDRAKMKGGKESKKRLINRIIDQLDRHRIPHKMGERIR